MNLFSQVWQSVKKYSFIDSKRRYKFTIGRSWVEDNLFYIYHKVINFVPFGFDCSPDGGPLNFLFGSSIGLLRLLGRSIFLFSFYDIAEKVIDKCILFNLGIELSPKVAVSSNSLNQTVDQSQGQGVVIYMILEGQPLLLIQPMRHLVYGLGKPSTKVGESS